LARWASWMGLVALVGGTSQSVDQAPPPRPPPVQVAPPADMRFGPRHFARATDNFSIAVRRLSTNPTPPSDRDLAYAIELFARAIESAPYAETVRGQKAAADMRLALRDASLAGPPGSPAARQALDDALFIGTDVLLALAYGPFQESGRVTSMAWELENLVYGQGYQRSLQDPEHFAIVLQQSAFLLKGIRESGIAHRHHRCHHHHVAIGAGERGRAGKRKRSGSADS